MAKVKVYVGGQWVIADGKNADTCDNLHFRVNAGKLQYSTDGTSFTDAGTNTGDATAGAGDILSGKTAYGSAGTKLTGTMTNLGALVFTPSATTQTAGAGYTSGVTVNGNANLVAGNIKYNVNIFGVVGSYDYEASQPITAGDILSGKIGFVNGTKITGTMVNRGSPTWTPTTSNQSLSAGYYSGGTVAGDANLVTGNIRAGATIFGVAGKASVVDTADATATAGVLLAGYTAYVNGSKITGTIPVMGDEEYAGWRRAELGQVGASAGRAHMRIPTGAYLGHATWPQGNGYEGIFIDDANFNPVNIKSGVSILGLAGTLQSLDALNGGIDEYLVDAGCTVTAGQWVIKGDYYNTVRDFNQYGSSKAPYYMASANYGGDKLIFHSASISGTHSATLDENKSIVVYNASNQIYARVLTSAGGVMSAGTSVALVSGSTVYSGVRVTALSPTKALITYIDGTNNYYVYAKVLTISGTTITVGSANVVRAVSTAGYDLNLCAISDTKAVNIVQGIGKGIVLTISGDTVTSGGDVSLTGLTYNYGSWNTSSLKVIDSTRLLYSTTNSSYYPTVSILTVSGNSISVGNVYVVHSDSVSADGMDSEVMSPTTIMCMYQRDNSNQKTGMVALLTYSGNTISMPTDTRTTYNSQFSMAYAKLCGAGSRVAIGVHNSSSGWGTIRPFAVSESGYPAYMSGGQQSFHDSSSTSGWEAGSMSLCKLSARRVALTYRDGRNGSYGTACSGSIYPYSSGIGIAMESKTGGQTVKVKFG